MHPEALTEQSKQIFTLLKKFPGFYLAGGTALALQMGHRISVDFDLFSDHEIKKDLLSKVQKEYSSLPLNISVNNADELTVFLGGTKLTFLYYPFPVIFDFVTEGGLPILSVKEIAATKAYTIGCRRSYKDYIDLYFVVVEKHASLEEVIATAEKKYGGAFNSRLFLEQLVYLTDIEDTEIEFLREGPKSKEALQDFFSKEIEKMAL